MFLSHGYQLSFRELHFSFFLSIILFCIILFHLLQKLERKREKLSEAFRIVRRVRNVETPILCNMPDLTSE